MNTTRLLSIIALSLVSTSQAQAIDPVYEGDDGVLAQVFATNCLNCHSSTLAGASRKGAPIGVNFDTFQAASANSAKAIMRAVTMKNMPPSFSPLPKLNEQQMQALVNWQALDLPDHNLPPIYSIDSTTLQLSKVYVKDEQGEITQKLMVEMALIQGQQPIQFELTHFHTIEESSERSRP